MKSPIIPEVYSNEKSSTKRSNFLVPDSVDQKSIEEIREQNFEEIRAKKRKKKKRKLKQRKNKNKVIFLIAKR